MKRANQGNCLPELRRGARPGAPTTSKGCTGSVRGTLALTGITSCQAPSKAINSEISLSNHNVLFSSPEGLLSPARQLCRVCPSRRPLLPYVGHLQVSRRMALRLCRPRQSTATDASPSLLLPGCPASWRKYPHHADRHCADAWLPAPWPPHSFPLPCVPRGSYSKCSITFLKRSSHPCSWQEVLPVLPLICL